MRKSRAKSTTTLTKPTTRCAIYSALYRQYVGDLLKLETFEVSHDHDRLQFFVEQLEEASDLIFPVEGVELGGFGDQGACERRLVDRHIVSLAEKAEANPRGSVLL